MFDLNLSDEAATLTFAGAFAKACSSNGIIFLKGNLGAGKTTFVRGFLKGLGYNGKVKSPTYTLVEPYEFTGRRIFHFDLYRLRAADELENIGLRDYLSSPAILLIEWPERGEKLLPAPDIIIQLATNLTGRQIKITSYTDVGKQILHKLNV